MWCRSPGKEKARFKRLLIFNRLRIFKYYVLYEYITIGNNGLVCFIVKIGWCSLPLRCRFRILVLAFAFVMWVFQLCFPLMLMWRRIHKNLANDSRGLHQAASCDDMDKGLLRWNYNVLNRLLKARLRYRACGFLPCCFKQATCPWTTRWKTQPHCHGWNLNKKEGILATNQKGN